VVIQDGQIKAGNLNQLLLHLTKPYDQTSDSGSGSDFFQTFLVTLQTFTTPLMFLQKLEERFSIPQEIINVASNAEHESFKAMKAKVCNVLYVLSTFPNRRSKEKGEEVEERSQEEAKQKYLKNKIN